MYHALPQLLQDVAVPVLPVGFGPTIPVGASESVRVVSGAVNGKEAIPILDSVVHQQRSRNSAPGYGYGFARPVRLSQCTRMHGTTLLSVVSLAGQISVNAAWRPSPLLSWV